MATVFIVHKRELSDSRVESGSSLFYLLHCSAYDRLNTTTFRSFRNIPHGSHQSSGHNHRCCNNFASAYPARIASCWMGMSTGGTIFASAHPARVASLSRRRLNRLNSTLPQHIPHGLHHRRWKTATRLAYFASAHPARIASRLTSAFVAAERLCLSTSRTDCIFVKKALEQIKQHFASAHPARTASYVST